MSIHDIVLAILATLSPPDEPPNGYRPEVKPNPDHYFCCGTVDNTGRGSGTECRKATEDEANLCGKTLCCQAGWTKSDGTVHCTAASQTKLPPPDQFCCDSTGTDDLGRPVGEGCKPATGDTCEARDLACFDSWTMSDGHVTCL